MENEHVTSSLSSHLGKGTEKQDHDPQVTDVEIGESTVKHDRGMLHASFSSRKLQVRRNSLWITSLKVISISHS
jgi:hypothetical protein